MICLISWPILIASRCDWHQLKGLLKGFKPALRPWESSKNWWRYDRMKFVTMSFLRSVEFRRCRTKVETHCKCIMSLFSITCITITTQYIKQSVTKIGLNEVCSRCSYSHILYISQMLLFLLEGWRAAIAVGTNDGPLTGLSNR